METPARVGDITSAVQQLEAVFLKAECDLSYVSRKLDTEFETVFADNGQENINPRKIVQRIEKLRKEMERLRVLHVEVEKEKQAFVTATVPVLLSNNKLASELARCAALPVHVSEEQEELENMCQSKGQSQEDKSDELNATFSIESTDTATDKPALTQAPVRSRASFVPVTEAEFAGVSDLVRGRVKLSEVNHAFELIFNVFKKDKKREQLGVKEMSAMGLTVTGATGEAKLKVLRALKLLSLAKDGSSVKLNL